MKICFVGCPKKFHAPWLDLQVRAIESWKNVEMESEVCIVAPQSDIETLPAGLVDYAVVAKENELSPLPLFGDIMSEAYRCSDADLFCYLNSDIIVPTNFGQEGLEQLEHKFLVIGSRWDMAEDAEYPVSHTRDDLARCISRNLKVGKVELHGPTAVDYFIFRRSTFDQLKPLIIGRGGYDAALLAFCLRSQIQLVDATKSYPILHQFHDYSHIKGAMKRVMKGEEATYNREAHDIVHSGPIILDALYEMKDGHVERSVWRCGIIRRLELVIRFHCGFKYLSYLLRSLHRVVGIKTKAYHQYIQTISEIE
jgi:hypothetical protein